MEPKILKKKDFLLNLIAFLVVKFDLSLISSTVVFNFTSSGSKDFNINIANFIYIPGGYVYPIEFVMIYFTSSIFSTSLFVNCIWKTISTRSFYSAFSNSSIASFSRLAGSENLYTLSPMFI